MTFSLPPLPTAPASVTPQIPIAPTITVPTIKLPAAPTASSPPAPTSAAGSGSSVGNVVDVAAGQLDVISGAAPLQVLTTFNIGADATLGLEASSTTELLTTINLDGSRGTLVLGASFHLDSGSQITGFTDGDKIDCLAPAASLTTAYTPSVSLADVLITPAVTTVTLADDLGRLVGTLRLVGDYRGTLGLTPDGMGGTSVVCLCLLAGTAIRTPDGETAVEALCPGAMVSTPDGPRAVTWVGHRRLDIADHPAPDAIRPIRIAAGAFGDGVPSRDLIVSPDHAIYVDGVMIPAKYLENATTVARDPTIPRPLYVHVELEQHGVLYAEGLTVESFLDIGGNSFFEGRTEVPAVHQELTRAAWEARGYAPLVVTGPVLDAVRLRLAECAARIEQPAALVHAA